MSLEALAFWVSEPGTGEIRRVPLAPPGASEVLVRTLATAVSRGTEGLVFRGEVPVDQHDAMRAPFQEGRFPGPVKYGYLNVGVVEAGPAPLLGRTVFCLYPHQTRYVVPASSVTLVPDDVPPRRATLAGLVETALNASWDAGVRPGDRVTVVGAGSLGCCVARLLSGIVGTRVTLVDVDPAREDVAHRLGVGFAPPHAAAGEQDLVVHTSATSEGLQRSLELLASEGTAVELSWYGDRPVSVALGGVFHSRRLTLRSSQVGTVSPARGGRTAAARLALALDLLRDPAYDAVLGEDSPFERLPDLMPALAARTAPGLTHTLTYEEEPLPCSA